MALNPNTIAQAVTNSPTAIPDPTDDDPRSELFELLLKVGYPKSGDVDLPVINALIAANSALEQKKMIKAIIICLGGGFLAIVYTYILLVVH